VPYWRRIVHIDGDDSGVESMTATEGNTIKQNSIQILDSGINRKKTFRHLCEMLVMSMNEHVKFDK